MAVDRIDAARQMRQHHSLISRPCANFQNLIAFAHLKGLGHQPHHGRLRDGLTRCHRQGHIFIGPIREMAAHEHAAVDFFHSRQNTRIADPLGAQGEQKLHFAFGQIAHIGSLKAGFQI